ncbi:MAG TPA: hypothetical protein VG838_01670 [Opitutaceae bacterium]|nr:hypothetical protein [Opitutaceae bacterium]
MNGLAWWGAVAILPAALLIAGFLLWSPRRRGRKRAALLVRSEAAAALDAKVGVFRELLHCRLASKGLATPLALRPVTGGAPEVETGDHAAALACGRSLNADYVLVVSMDDLNCEVDETQPIDLESMRVNTTLCVAYEVLEMVSGRSVAGRSLALCRNTSPIVSGTSVGSDTLDGLLQEAADSIGEQIGALRLAGLAGIG